MEENQQQLPIAIVFCLPRQHFEFAAVLYLDRYKTFCIVHKAKIKAYAEHRLK